MTIFRILMHFSGEQYNMMTFCKDINYWHPPHIYSYLTYELLFPQCIFPHQFHIWFENFNKVYMVLEKIELGHEYQLWISLKLVENWLMNSFLDKLLHDEGTTDLTTVIAFLINIQEILVCILVWIVNLLKNLFSFDLWTFSQTWFLTFWRRVHIWLQNISIGA